MSIPTLSGFSPTRWRDIVDIMLTKQPGDHRVHRLHIIALLESDFNQVNRLLIGRPVQYQLEDNKELPDMQHGSRSDKQCHSAVLNKVLNFEIHRYQKPPLAYIENDAVGCFDRIINPLVIVFLRILGVPHTDLYSLASTWETTRHKIRTLYGISEEGCANDPTRLLYGPGQGSTIGPFLWLLCFILVHCSLSATSPRIHLMSVDRREKLKCVGEAFVDDTGLGTNSTGLDNLLPSSNVQTGFTTLINNLQTLAQEWEKLLFSTGGALNLTKCFWFLLAWDCDHGKAKITLRINRPW
jgi:hypothetical protein